MGPFPPGFFEAPDDNGSPCDWPPAAVKGLPGLECPVKLTAPDAFGFRWRFEAAE